MVILIVALGFRFAEPITDGDLFWQIEYGRQLVENRTLVPDHTLYSWTPSSNETIYCAWISQLFLYFLDLAGGLKLFFVLRYLCVLAFVLAVWWFGHRLGIGKHPLTFAVMLAGILAAYLGTYIKPELFSLIFFLAAALVYFGVKASLWPGIGSRLFYVYPILFLLWVNSHGVFIFGLALLAVLVLAEGVNRKLSPKIAMARRDYHRFAGAAILSAGTILLTPYGFRMPGQLLPILLSGEQGDQNLMTVGAHLSTFAGSSRLHTFEFFILFVALLGGMYLYHGFRRKQWDWGILIPNLFLAYLYTRFLRTTYYWAPFWCFSILYLRHRLSADGTAHRTPMTFIIRFLAVLYVIFLAARAVYDVRYDNFPTRWAGFGISYYNPVDASDFLKQYHPGERLYNSYTAGGYLLYDLYPLYKVFCDPRYFPYKDWYPEYYRFNNGPTPIEEFQKKYPFDVALIDYHTSTALILKFLQSRAWKPIFYGPFAMVFAQKALPFPSDLTQLDPARFDDQLHSLTQAHLVFAVAVELGDLETSGRVLNVIRREFRGYPRYERTLRECSLAQQGLTAFKNKEYEKAFAALYDLGYRDNAPRTNFALLYLTNYKVKQLVGKNDLEAALKLMEAMLRHQPDYEDFLFNAGVIGYLVEKHAPANPNAGLMPQMELLSSKTDWQRHFMRLLKLNPNHRYADLIRRVLNGEDLPKQTPLIL